MDADEPVEAVGIVLAAGRSARMGRSKPALGLGGQTFLAGALRALGSSAPLIIVVAPGQEAAARLSAADADARVVVTPHPDRGMLASIRTGLDAAGHPWAFVLPVDCPAVDPRTVALLEAAVRGTGGVAAAVPVYEGRTGHPVLLGPPMHRAVREADDAGLGVSLAELLERTGEGVARVQVGDAAVLDNVNTPADLERLRARRLAAEQG